jgi:radical SAM protein with 4Fe4S-binding SPASM domain
VSIKGSAKKIVKKVVSPVVLKNLRGISGAVTTYYPEYLFGDGKITSLKNVSIEVTFRCNCRCQMCPLYGIQTGGGKELSESIREQEEMKLEEYERLFRELRALNTESVNFTGGEAFLRRDMLDITKLAREAGLEVSFTSNGGMLTREIAQKVVELGVDGITISLDGPKEVHEEIRKAKVFDRVMEAVDWIEEEKRKQGKAGPIITFLCTVSALNQHHLVGIVEIARKKNLTLAIDPIIFTSDEIWESSKEAVQEEFVKQESFVMPDEIGKVDTDALEKELQKVFDQAKKLNQPVYISLAGKNNRKKFFEDPKYSTVHKCFAPWYSCRIDPYGNVYPCSLSICMGNVREQPMPEIVNGEKFMDFRKKLKANKLMPFCSKCCVLYSHNKFWDFLPKI